MPEVKKAGALILSSKSPHQLLLVYRGNHDDWSFPKGHTEEGEDALSTMKREIQEETGLEVGIIAELPPLSYHHKSGSQVVTDMFLVRSLDDSTLSIEHEGDKLAFFNLNEVGEKLTYENLQEYFKQARPLIDQRV